MDCYKNGVFTRRRLQSKVFVLCQRLEIRDVKSQLTAGVSALFCVNFDGVLGSSDASIEGENTSSIKIPVALFDWLRYNVANMKYYAISVNIFKKGILWLRVNT